MFDFKQYSKYHEFCSKNFLIDFIEIALFFANFLIMLIGRLNRLKGRPSWNCKRFNSLFVPLKNRNSLAVFNPKAFFIDR